MWYLNYNIPAFLSGAGKYHTIAFDVETDLDKNLKLIQLGLPNGHQFLFDITHLSEFKAFLESKTLIAHNAIFEIERMAEKGIYPKKWIDTMLIENILLAGDPYNEGSSLDKTLLRHLGIKMDKTMQTTFGQSLLTKAHYDYAAKDVQHLHDLLEQQMAHPDYNEAVVKLEMDYLNVVAEMTLTGMVVDVEGWKKVVELGEQQKEQQIKILDQLHGGSLFGNINWSSPKQKLEVLHSRGIMVESTSKDELVKYKNDHFVSELIKYADINSRITKLGDKFLAKVKDGRIHTQYKQIIATGRSSSKAVNLQNIPKSYRHHFKPTVKGNVFVSADFSQQELIILGFISGEQQWLDAVKNGVDLHTYCAMALYPDFDKMSDEVQKEQRKKIKAINFSLAYGTGLRELARSLGISYNECFDLVIKYVRQFPNVEKYLRRQSKQGKEDKVSTTLPPFNRKRILRDESLGAMGRKAKNTPIQGAAADMMKLACNKIMDKRNGTPFKFTHVIHDEIVVECDPDHASIIEKLLLDCMMEAGDEICPKGYIHADSEITQTWH